METGEAKVAARDALLRVMGEISESERCSGWYVGLEFVLWDRVLAYRTRSGYPHQQPWFHDQARELAFLAEVADGWWKWGKDEKHEVFVSLELWEPEFAEYASRQTRRGWHDAEREDKDDG